MFTREAIEILSSKSDMLQSLVTPCGMLGGMYGMINCATSPRKSSANMLTHKREKLWNFQRGIKEKKEKKIVFSFLHTLWLLSTQFFSLFYTLRLWVFIAFLPRKRFNLKNLHIHASYSLQVITRGCNVTLQVTLIVSTDSPLV